MCNKTLWNLPIRERKLEPSCHPFDLSSCKGEGGKTGVLHVRD
jgi:hypothetical protein